MITAGLQLPGGMPLARYPALARLAESLPFSRIGVQDNILHKGAWPLVTLLALNSERLEVGPSVSHPFVVHPVVLAANIATIEELSGGRAVLGLGRGSFYHAIDLRPPPAVPAMAEALDVIRHFLQAGGPDGAGGRWFRAAPQAHFLFEPPTRRIPVILGALGPRACRLAGEKADGVSSAGVWHPDYVGFLRGAIAEGARAAGRDPSTLAVGVHAWTAIGADRAAAQAEARARLALYLPHIKPLTDFFAVPSAEIAAVAEAQGRGDMRAAEAAVSDRSLDLFMAVGTPRDIVERARRMIDAGATNIVFDVGPGAGAEDAIRLLGTQVLPELGITMSTI